MNDNKKEYLIEVDGRKGKVKSEDFENNLDQFIEELPQARITVTSPDGIEGSVPLSNYKNAISKGYSAVFATYPAQQGEPAQEKSQMLPSEPQALTRHFDMTNNEVVKQTMDNNGSQKIGNFAASIPQVPIIPGQSPLDYAEKVTAVADRIQQQEAEKQQEAAKEAALPQTLEEIDDKLKKIEFELKDKYDDRTGTMYSPESSDFMQIKLFNPKKNNYTPEQIKEKTALEQQRKALLLQKKFLDSIQEYQAYDQKGDQSRINRFLGGLAAKGDLQDFATLGISEITRDLEFAGILGKAERGEKLTLDESKAIQLYQNLKEIESLDRGAFFNAGAGAQQSFELMRDMLLGGMGGGISTIGRLGIKEAIKSASKQFAKKSLETMYKTALMPSFYRNVAKGNVENYSIENVGTEDKPVWDVNMKDPMSKMLYKQWAQQYSEVLTENLGSAFESVGLLTHIAKKASKAGGIIGKGARLYDKIHNKAIHNNVSKYIVEGLDKMGLQSFPMEFIEEIANVPLQSMLLGENQFKQLADPRFYQEVAISTAALSGVGGAVNVAAGGTSALIERRKSDKAIENYTQSIQDAIDNIDDVSHKAALSDLLSDLDKANYYDANGEFDGSQIMDDLSRVKYFEGDSQTYKDVESLVKEKLYREGQTQALKAIMEDEVGQIEYGTSGDVMAAKDKDDTFLFILGETDDTYLVSNPLTKQQKVISKADINQISAPVSVDRAVTDYFVTKATPAVTTPMPDISQVQQTQQEAQTETAQSQVPLQKGDKATYEGVSVTVDDVYTDNDGNTVAIITDDNNNSHNVPLESLSKMEPIVNKDRYILPDGRRAVIVGSDGDNIILDIIDDNNNIIDKIAAKADEISTFDKVPAEQANTIEGITSEQQAPPQEAQQPDEVQQQPQQSELPVDKDGNIDYDALLESDPERFIQEYSKVVEPQVVLEQLSEVVQEIDKEIQAKNKAIKKTTSFNKKASLSTDVSKLQKRRDSLTSQLLKLTQPQHESQKQIQSPIGGDIISQRWNNATKVRGNSDTRTLSDGSQLKGHWVLAEADAPTPSHDPHTLSPSEGFPTTSEGKNINDNDYTKKSAEVRIMAADYDGRAIDNPIFVKDGVVISGNNRTMSGLLAAENGTDSKYLQALQQRAQSLGFTAEQIASMKHPRVFFEVEDDVPMTTEMFAKFNQREKKSKTPTERAIVASKRDNSRLIGLILSEIDKHEKLSDVYQDANSSAAIVKYMTQTGLINSNEVPELFENGAFTANGKDFLESLLIGSIIKEDQIKILNTEGMKNIRSKIVKSIIPLAENYKLRKENQIIDDVNQAVLYLYQAKAAKLTLGELIRQNDMFESKLFDEDAVFVALKLQQSEKDFRNFVEQVNARLSTETANMFTGELETKQDIYGEFDQQLSDSERAVIEGARENNILSQESTLPSDGSGPITRRSEPDGVLKEPESEVQIKLGNLRDNEGNRFYEKNGSIDIWDLSSLLSKARRQVAPVRLTDRNLAHIIESHNKEFKNNPQAIIRFIDNVLNNAKILRKARAGAIFAVVENDKTDKAAIIKLYPSKYGDYYNVETAGYYRKSKWNREDIIAELSEPIQSDTATDASKPQTSTDSGEKLLNAEAAITYESKVSKLASDIQQQSTQTVLEKAQNNAINNEIDSQAQQTNTSPSQAQKEAGNYKMGHVKVQGLNISIENPAGSTRSGVDANGQKWSVTMNNHYGYIRGTKGKDKDHIDVFLGKNQLSDKVYVIDQVNNDGSFDEHKVMIGFDSAQQARQAYLSNYSEGWNGLGNITEVSMREFKSWIDNGTRKVKPFAEYRSHSLDAIKQQAMEYSQKYGTSVEVVENAEDIKNPYARMAAQQYGLYGWYDVNSKKVYVYAPNIINNPSELEKTVLHEVVAHKGLRELLGEVAFNKLCDDVWNMMSQQDKIKWAAYAMQVAPSEVDLSQVEKGLKVKREAADEYMASFAEDGIKDQSVWQKIKQVVMDALRAMGINIQLSDADIAYMLYRSSQALKKNATIKEKAAAKKKSEQIENDLSDENIAKEKGFEEPLRLRRQKEENKINSLIGLHNISEQKLRKAIKQGGLANPSAAVIDIDKQSHDSYGEISLLMPKTLVDKKTGRNAGTFLADAWTPVYPGIRKQMSDKGSREYRKAIANLDTPLKNKIALYFQNYLDSTTVYDALFYWYALDRGLNPELVTKGLGDFTQQKIDSIKALSEDGKSFWSLPEVSQQALIDAYKEKEGGVEAYNEKIKGIVEKLKANVGNLQGLRKKQVEQKIEDYEKYGVSIKSVADYYNNALRVIENFGKVDEYSTYYRAVKYVDDNNLRGDMDRWLSEKEKQFDVSEKLYAGTDNQGRQKWIPNTLENASGLMNRQGVAGAQGSASFNHFIAMAAPKATSLKQIKAKQGNLSDEEQYEQFRQEWNDIYQDLALQLQPGASAWDDYGQWRLEEMLTVSNPKAFIKKEYGIELSDEFMSKFYDLVGAIKNDFPARYFETKFTRPVMLDEFAAAVVPDNVGDDVKQALINAGLNVATYEHDNNDQRKELIKQLSDDSIRFRYKTSSGKNVNFAQLSLFDQPAEVSQDEVMLGRKLRPLQEGEFCHVERIFTKSKMFDFTAGERIESMDDVAYIFSQLEDASIENAFAVLVKDGKPYVIHIGMGDFSSSVMNIAAIVAADNLIKADSVYMVHNHPSGNLKCSRADIGMLQKFKKAFGDRAQDGIIINLKTGQYGIFTENGIEYRADKKSPESEFPIEIYSFNKQVFDYDYDPTRLAIINSSLNVAQFISGHRLGNRAKVNILILNNRNGVVGNILSERQLSTMKDDQVDAFASEIVDYTHKMGGVNAIVYGSDIDILDNGKQKLIEKISRSVRELSGQSINVIDWLYVEGNAQRYKSAMDEGVRFRRELLNEEQYAEYQREFDKAGNNIQERVDVINRFILEINDDPFVVLTRYNVVDKLNELGCTEEQIDNIERSLKRYQIPGCYINGQMIFIADDIIDIEDARQTLVHERQHYLTRQNPIQLINSVYNGVESIQQLEDIVVNLSNDENYRGVHEIKLADEFISYSMQEAYSNTNFADILKTKGVTDDLISFITKLNNEQATQESLFKSRRWTGRDIHGNKVAGRYNQQNGRDQTFRSQEMVEQGTGSSQVSRTGAREGEISIEDPESKILFRRVTDPVTLEKLNSEPTIKVYRAMQVIDGKLYPPMSAVVDGKLRQPTEFGVWEEAEENPELADEKGYFKLNKGNKKSLKARYNPYIHTSRTPLNDQFSEAQTRPNLVTVEVEVPQSELTSGYKAPKAKDSVGEMEWKAGVVQSKLTGKRKVILSRWDKPVRIMPDSEVAEKIVEMFGGKNIVMPSNVVTPSLRSELEKRGVPFVETDNKGKQIRFRYAPIFQSNAERATLNIKQEKATPQQWIAMLQKNGGLKAGEDKWLGLTDWLKNQNGSVTKQQILDYIRQNGIQIEEVNYVDSDNYQEKPIEDFLTEEYGYQYTQAFYVENWAGEPQAMIENLESAVELYNQYNNTKIEYSEDLSDDDYDKLLDWGQQAVNEAYIKQKKSSLNTINPVRLDYTTDFLTNNREIALVVPTIKPWNIHDEIHFGDAGEGRVVAWVRFGTTFLAREVPFVKSADNLKPPYKNVNGNEVYAVQDTKNDYIVHKSIGGGVMKYIPHVNNRLIGNTVDTAAFDTLEQAQSALNTFYKEHPLKRTVSDNILVIDEIQSKRHQEGRDKGYSSSMEGMTAERLPSGIWHIMKDGKFVAPVPSWEADSEQQALEVYAKKLVPDAPFEKNWHEVALKRMLRYAAENNYDTLAWTRGAQQAERYNIGHVVDDIWHMSDRNHFNLNRDGYSIGSVKIDKDGTIVDGNRIFEDQIGNPLSDVVGKDLANKMINSQPNDEIKLDGRMIGGEGMRGFYDKMLVDYMNKYGKKWGVKVEDIFLPDLGDRGLTMHSVKVTDAMKESVLNESQLLFRRALDGEAVTPDMIAADGIRKTMGEQSYQKMIDGIFNTLPLLEKAAIIKRGENKEKVVASIVDRICNDIPANRDALMETLIIVKDALKENPLVVLPSDTDLLVQLWKETNLEPAMTIREKLANLDKANQIRFKIDDKNDKAPATNDVKLTRAQVWQERMVDRMVAVKVFYDELAKIGIKPSIDMNSYITENLAMSRAQTEDNHFKENIYRPMVEKVIEIEKLFIKMGLAKNDQQAYKLVNDYLYARHAPERNKNICCEEVMEKMMRSIDKIDAGFFKDGARNALMALASRIYNEKNNPSAPSTYKTFAKNIIKTKPDDPSHQQAFLQFQKKWEKLVEQAKTDMDNIFSSKSGTNRSGMTDAEAKEIISKVYTDQTKQQLEELSDKVRQSTHFTIDTWEKYGLIDSQTGANMKKMYKYYIPLRSWEEKEDVDYDQLSNQAFNKASEIINLNRKARGRKSRADEPLVYIASLAQSAIVVGNKNMIRLNLFRLIKANDNNPALAQFASLPKVYYVETPESDTAVAYTERPAQELFDRGLVKTKTNKDYRWHKSHSEYDAHIVPVMVNGTRQMIELRGELGIKVASAINNTNVLHWQAANALKPMTNWLSAVRTSYNPEFVLTNFIRDFMFANMAYSVEGGNMLDLDKNLLKAFRSIHHLQRGKSVGDKWDAYYQEFLDNGGQTGFFAMRNIDKMKKDLETLHKQLQGGKMTVHKISQTAKNIAEYSNAMSESAMRLAAYITEREKGTSAKEAAYKAHEISVNFNRKGTWSGNFGGFYSFFNASVQGTARLGSLVWNNKGKAAAALAAISLAKLATAVIAAAVGGDDYDQLSDYVKFSNIVIPIGKDDNDKTRFLCIPMAQGVRAVTNIADNTVEVLTGNKTVWEASKTTLLNTVGEFVPLSFDAIDLTGRNTSYSIAAAIAPTAIQPWMDVWVNMDFKGDPIYKEPYMKPQEGFTPEYMNVYGNTNPILVGISKWLNDVAGGSDGRSASVWVDKNGKVKKSPFGYALDINPAKVEHLLNAYFGGLMSFPSNVIKTGYAIIDSETDVEIYNTPVVNRFIKKPYYQDGYADYFKVRDYVQTVKMTISAAKKAGDIEAAMNIQKRNTKLLMVYKSYEDRVKQLKELLNNDNLSAVNRDKLNKKMDEVILQASKDLNKIMTDEKDSRD